MDNGFNDQCFAPCGVRDEPLQVGTAFDTCDIQKFYARVINFMYLNDGPAIGAMFFQLLGPRVTVTFHDEIGLLPAVVTVISPTLTIIVIDGTRTVSQFVMQAFTSLQRPTNQGPFSTLPLWWLAAQWAHTHAMADGQVSGTPCMIVGHSYGGAAALVLAARYRFWAPARTIRFLTFGTPKTGDARMHSLVASCQGINLANDDDLAPVFPPDFRTLLPVMTAMGQPGFAVWADWVRPPNQVRMDPDGSLEPNNLAPTDFSTLFAAATNVILHQAVNPGAGHSITEYIRRLNLRCPVDSWPFLDPCVPVPVPAFGGIAWSITMPATVHGIVIGNVTTIGGGLPIGGKTPAMGSIELTAMTVPVPPTIVAGDLVLGGSTPAAGDLVLGGSTPATGDLVLGAVFVPPPPTPADGELVLGGSTPATGEIVIDAMFVPPPPTPATGELVLGGSTPQTGELVLGGSTPQTGELVLGGSTPQTGELVLGGTVPPPPPTPATGELVLGGSTPAAGELVLGGATPAAGELVLGGSTPAAGELVLGFPFPLGPPVAATGAITLSATSPGDGHLELQAVPPLPWPPAGTGGVVLGATTPATGELAFGATSPATGELAFGATSPATGELAFGVTPPATGELAFGVTPPATGELAFGVTPPATGSLKLDAIPPPPWPPLPEGSLVIGSTTPGDGDLVLDGVSPGDGDLVLDGVSPGDGDLVLDGVNPGDGDLVLDGVIPEQGALALDVSTFVPPGCVFECDQCPEGMSKVWLLTVAGISNDECVCVDYNGDFTLTNNEVLDCVFFCDQLVNLCFSGFGAPWTLSYNPADDEWLLQATFNDTLGATYRIDGDDWDCNGPNTLLYVMGGTGACGTWPETLTVTPEADCS